MRLVRTAAQVAILAFAPSLAALAETGDSGAQQAGGAFMTSYPPAATSRKGVGFRKQHLGPAGRNSRGGL